MAHTPKKITLFCAQHSMNGKVLAKKSFPAKLTLSFCSSREKKKYISDVEYRLLQFSTDLLHRIKYAQWEPLAFRCLSRKRRRKMELCGKLLAFMCLFCMVTEASEVCDINHCLLPYKWSARQICGLICSPNSYSLPLASKILRFARIGANGARGMMKQFKWENKSLKNNWPKLQPAQNSVRVPFSYSQHCIFFVNVLLWFKVE